MGIETGEVARTHDYTVKTWGHDLTYAPTGHDYDIRGSIWGENLKNGDYLILKNGDSTTRYEITELRTYPHNDPPDMRAFTARFAPRGD